MKGQKFIGIEDTKGATFINLSKVTRIECTRGDDPEESEVRVYHTGGTFSTYSGETAFALWERLRRLPDYVLFVHVDDKGECDLEVKSWEDDNV
jgi:hypothetical protein